MAMIQQILLGTQPPAAPLSLSVVPPTVFSFAEPPYPTIATTLPATAQATGGSGNYTYTWSRVSGDNNIGMVFGPSEATQAWNRSISIVDTGQSFQAIYRVVVNDGSTSVSQDVTVTIQA